MPTSTIPASRARKELFAIIERVQKPTTPYVRLTVKGEGKAIIMSEDEWESWRETVAIMSDPEAVEGIRRAREEFARGEYRDAEEFFRELEAASHLGEAKEQYGSHKKKVVKQPSRSKSRAPRKSAKRQGGKRRAA